MGARFGGTNKAPYHGLPGTLRQKRRYSRGSHAVTSILLVTSQLPSEGAIIQTAA